MAADMPAKPNGAFLRPELYGPLYEGCATTPVNLVLEGGAMRGQFTAGVLDFFMEHGLWAQHVIGTSAGALNGYHYVAGEFGRTCYLNTKYCKDWRFMSMRSFALTGNAFGVEFSFDTIPNELEPFDYNNFRNSPMLLTSVASNLETGEADYFCFERLDGNIDYLVATSSMPLVSKTVEIDGKKLLDGGICDSVPIIYSMLTGARKHIVVLTQNVGYVKKPSRFTTLARQRYAEYPYFLERMQYRHLDYNRTYRQLIRLHAEKKVFVIWPPKPVGVVAMEKNVDKLLDLYADGYEEAGRCWAALQDYLAL